MKDEFYYQEKEQLSDRIKAREKIESDHGTDVIPLLIQPSADMRKKMKKNFIFKYISYNL